MSMTDPIADMLTRIRNALQARHKRVLVPASGIKIRIAEILQEEGFVDGYRVIEQAPQNGIELDLRYHDTGRPVIEGVERLSRPGLRRYSGWEDLPRFRNGLGVTIVSTSRGVMTARDARKVRVGGELICHVW